MDRDYIRGCEVYLMTRTDIGNYFQAFEVD